MELQERLERARDELRDRDKIITDLRKKGSDQINLSPTPTQSLSPLHTRTYLTPPPAHVQSPSRAVALEALEQDLFELQRGLARYRSRSPTRASQGSTSQLADETDGDLERRIRSQLSKQIREEMEADFRELLKKELEHRNAV